MKISINSGQFWKSGIADHALQEGHKIGERKQHYLVASEGFFITEFSDDKECVNSMTASISDPLNFWKTSNNITGL